MTTAGVADFNLGSVMRVDRVALWNFGSGLSFAVTQVSLVAGTDAAFTTMLSLGTFNLAVIGGLNPAQIFSFPAVNAPYIRFQNFVDNGAGSIGLGELAFSTNAVPEPASVWLLSLGLLGLGAHIKRLNQKREKKMRVHSGCSSG